MLRVRKLIHLCCIVALVSCSVPAQTSTRITRADWGNLQKLHNGARIYVRTKQGAEYEGDFKGAPADVLLMVNVAGSPTLVVEVARSEVREVRKLRSRFLSRAVGAGVGAGVGLLAGIGIGAAIDSRAESNEDDGLIGAVLGLIGAPIGASVGGRIGGKAFRKGAKVYVAP